MSYGPRPWQQRHWDVRAALNFIAGGAGAGLIVFTALAAGPQQAYAIGAALIALGLGAVALEIGRPLRALNVFRHPQRSWMSREAIAATALLACAIPAATGSRAAGLLAALLALVFVYCQGRMLRAAKGIPAWRAPRLVALLLATALAEGGGLHLLLTALMPQARDASGGLPFVWALWGVVLIARLALWAAWRRRVGGAPAALARIDDDGHYFKAASWLPLAAALVVVMSPLPPMLQAALGALAGALACAGGAWFKLSLILRVAFNQGFAIVHPPVRGAAPRP